MLSFTYINNFTLFSHRSSSTAFSNFHLPPSPPFIYLSYSSLFCRLSVLFLPFSFKFSFFLLFPPPPSLIFSLFPLYFSLFSPLLSLLVPSLMMTRLKEIVPDIRVMEAHGQHTDLEDRIDYFSSGQV